MTCCPAHRPDPIGPARPSQRRARWLLWLGAFFATTAQADLITVGAAGRGCDHTTIQAAIDDAALRPGADTIHISRTQAYVEQALVIDTSDSLTLAGRFETCASPLADPEQTELSGAGGEAAPVFRISAQAPAIVTLQGLRISGGDTPDDRPGGGIRYEGHGSELVLIESLVDGNSAGFGGGIAFFDHDGLSRLTIGRDTLILENVASSHGGGIYLDGGRLTMPNQGSSLVRNRAQAGGGLYVRGRVDSDTKAEIYSSGFREFATIDSNQAEIGGGVALQGVQGAALHFTTLTMFSIDPARPVRIASNEASVRGGAIAAQALPQAIQAHDLQVVLSRVVIEQNSAPDGTALSIGDAFDPEAGGGVALRMNLGAVTANRSVDGDGQPVAGPMISAAPDSDVEMVGVRMQDNEGGPLLRTSAARLVHVGNSLLTDNDIEGSVLELDVTGPFPARLQGTTITGNRISAPGAVAIIVGNGPLQLANSILWQPGRQTLDAGAATASDLLASETASLGGDASIVSAAPRFIDPARRDYRLQAASPAIDFSANITGADFDGAERGIDLDGVANIFGAADLGAYERQELGNLVLNDGFVEDLRLWNEAQAGAASHVAGGAGNPGAVRLSAPGPEPVRAGATLVGLTQCLHVPSPGRYRLDGMAYGIGADPASRDIASLRWRFRADTGDETCLGGIDDAGVVWFPPSDDFTGSVEPGVIEVPVAQWTRRSTIEIALQVDERGFLPDEMTTGFFDDIVLERLADPLPLALFADGFE